MRALTYGCFTLRIPCWVPIFALTVSAVWVNVHAEEPKRIINIAFSHQVFGNVNRNDAAAAIKVWTDAIAENRGINMKAETQVYDDAEHFKKSILNDQHDLVIINSTDYLDIESSKKLKPVFVPMRDRDEWTYYTLCTSTRKAWDTPSSLANKNLNLMVSTGSNLGRLWLNALLFEAGQKPAEELFAAVNEVRKVSDAVLPVFFGKQDACIVSRAGYNLMKELNPQIGTQITPRIESPPFVETLVCIREGYSHHRKDVMEALGELHLEPKGEQILLVFKLNKLLPFEEHHLETTRALQRTLHKNKGLQR